MDSNKHSKLGSNQRVGRPRNRPGELDGAPREQILSAAAALFEKHGFGATTTRQIAAAAGLEQGSMLYYFPRKAEILAELLSRNLEPAIANAKLLERLDALPEEKLYLLARYDTLNICSGPWNLALLMHLPEMKLPEFASYRAKRVSLKESYGTYIAGGLARGVFGGVDADLAAELVYGMVESSIDWFVRGRDDPEQAAKDVAQAVLSFLLTDKASVGEIVDQAIERTGADAATPGYVSQR